MTDALNVQAFSRLLDTPVSRLLNRRYNVPARWLMPLAFGDQRRWTPTMQHHYRVPLAEPDHQTGALVFTRELLDSTPFLSSLWERTGRNRRQAGAALLGHARAAVPEAGARTLASTVHCFPPRGRSRIRLPGTSSTRRRARSWFQRFGRPSTDGRRSSRSWFRDSLRSRHVGVKRYATSGS